LSPVSFGWQAKLEYRKWERAIPALERSEEAASRLGKGVALFREKNLKQSVSIHFTSNQALKQARSACLRAF
jgi:hypothetical protein